MTFICLGFGMNCYYLDYDVTMGFAANFTKVVQNLNLLRDEAEMDK
jgi:hypothetical protein